MQTNPDAFSGWHRSKETRKVCHILEELGMDAVEFSGGTFESGRYIPSRTGTAESEDREAYYREAAKRYKREISMPLILVGGFLSYPIAREVVKLGITDYVALARPLIREPHLIKRWGEKDPQKA